VLGTAIFLAERQRVAELAIKHRLPTMSIFKDNVEAGGLMSYSPDYDDLYRRGAVYVDISKHVGRVKSERVLV
jgi:hypothetical protein